MEFIPKRHSPLSGSVPARNTGVTCSARKAEVSYIGFLAKSGLRAQDWLPCMSFGVGTETDMAALVGESTVLGISGYLLLNPTGYCAGHKAIWDTGEGG